MELKTASGNVLTDALLDEMAKAYEGGAWTGTGEVTMGCPKLYEEDMETASFRIAPFTYSSY